MKEIKPEAFLGKSIHLSTEQVAIFNRYYGARFRKVGAEALSRADAELALLLMPEALRWEILASMATQEEPLK